MSTASVARAVPRELHEVDVVRNPDGARKVGEEDEARLERRNEKRFPAVVVACDLETELADASLDFLGGEVDVPDAGGGAQTAA